MLAGTALYLIQAPLLVTLNAHALAFMLFLRSFALVSMSIPLFVHRYVLRCGLVRRSP